MTDIETVERARAEAHADFDPEQTAHQIMRVANGLVADQNRAGKKSALDDYQYVADAVDGVMNLIDLQHAVQNRDAKAIGDLVLLCLDKALDQDGIEFFDWIRR